MTSTSNCEALREDIVSLLYDDGELAERSRAREHLAQCVECRSEYSEFKSIRKSLSLWQLPVAVEAPTPHRVERRWMNPALAAAAGLMLGIGAATVGRSAFTPGTAPAPAPIVSANAAAPAQSSTAQFVSFNQLQDALKAQETRHVEEMERLRAVIENQTVSGTPVRVSDTTIASFERLLRQSEERQARAFEARLIGLRNENDLQRQYDMAQVAASLAYIDSRTGADAARTSELMKNLVRVTAKPQDR